MATEDVTMADVDSPPVTAKAHDESMDDMHVSPIFKVGRIGTVPQRSGNISSSAAHYHHQSEKIPYDVRRAPGRAAAVPQTHTSSSTGLRLPNFDGSGFQPPRHYGPPHTGYFSRAFGHVTAGGQFQDNSNNGAFSRVSNPKEDGGGFPFLRRKRTMDDGDRKSKRLSPGRETQNNKIYLPTTTYDNTAAAAPQLNRVHDDDYHFHENLTRRIPGSFPDLPNVDRAPTQNSNVDGDAPMMSGALPETSVSSPVGNEGSRPPVTTSSDGSYYLNSLSWAINRAIGLAGTVKGFLTPRSRRRTSTRNSPSGIRTYDIHGLSDEERRRFKADQYRRQNGLPARDVQYPFPEITFELPRFPTAQNIAHAQRSPTPFSWIPTAPRKFRGPRSEEKGATSRDLVGDKASRADIGGRQDVQRQRRKSEVTKDSRRTHGALEQDGRKTTAEPEMTTDLASYLSTMDKQGPEVDRVSKPSADEKDVLNMSPMISSLWNEGEEPRFAFGPAVSAVSLFKKPAPLPPGRVESMYAREWREIEAAQKELEKEKIPRVVLKEGQAVRRLPDEWVQRVAAAMSQPNSVQVASTLAGDPLTRRDLATCYARHTWLNDEVINAYLALIVDYLKRTAEGNTGIGCANNKPRFHAFNSFFFSNLRDKGYDSVRRWAARAKIGGRDLLNVDTVFIPVHNGNHWTLIVVRPRERTIEHFDSLGRASQRFMGLVKEWLRRELASTYIDEEWVTVPSASPQQDNGFDCGVFLLSTAKAVALGIDPTSYNAGNICTLRLKIVAELMNGGFNGLFEPSVGGRVAL